MADDQRMGRRSRTAVVIAMLFATALAALAADALRADAALKRPKVVTCGDIVGGAWTVRDRVSGERLTGSHYTVAVINYPCASARTLVAKLTRRRSLGPGPTSLLRGFMCITGIPAGLQLQHGGCAVGTSPILMPTPNIKSFKWQACVSVPARHEHPSCTTRRLP